MESGHYEPLNQEAAQAVKERKSVFTWCTCRTFAVSLVVVIALTSSGLYLTRHGMEPPAYKEKQGAGLLFL